MTRVVHQTTIGSNKLQLIKEWDLFYILVFKNKKAVAMVYAGMPSYSEAIGRYRMQVTKTIGGLT
jgi:hypothetical protein